MVWNEQPAIWVWNFGGTAMLIEELDAMVRAVCPIDGINSKGVIWFKPEATPEQRAAAQALISEHLAKLVL